MLKYSQLKSLFIRPAPVRCTYYIPRRYISGEIDQLVRITSQANVAINKTNKKQLLNIHSFAFRDLDVKQITFNNNAKKLHEQEWFQYMVENSATRLWLVNFSPNRLNVPEHVAVAFSNAQG